jgi:hypothetical protein
MAHYGNKIDRSKKAITLIDTTLAAQIPTNHRMRLSQLGFDSVVAIFCRHLAAKNVVRVPGVQQDDGE